MCPVRAATGGQTTALQAVCKPFTDLKTALLMIFAGLPRPADMALFLLPGQSSTVHTGVPFSKPGARHG